MPASFTHLVGTIETVARADLGRELIGLTPMIETVKDSGSPLAAEAASTGGVSIPTCFVEPEVEEVGAASGAIATLSCIVCIHEADL